MLKVLIDAANLCDSLAPPYSSSYLTDVCLKSADFRLIASQLIDLKRTFYVGGYTLYLGAASLIKNSFGAKLNIDLASS